MVAKQQIAINSLIDRVNKLENYGKGMFFSFLCTVTAETIRGNTEIR